MLSFDCDTPVWIQNAHAKLSPAPGLNSSWCGVLILLFESINPPDSPARSPPPVPVVIIPRLISILVAWDFISGWYVFDWKVNAPVNVPKLVSNLLNSL